MESSEVLPASSGHTDVNFCLNQGSFYIGNDETDDRKSGRIARSLGAIEPKLSTGDGSIGAPRRTSSLRFAHLMEIRQKPASVLTENGKTEDLDCNRVAMPCDSTQIVIQDQIPPQSTLPPTSTACTHERQLAFEPRSRTTIFEEDAWRESAPNGEWGWLVVLGSFLCMFTVDGVCFCYGLLMHEMIVESQFSKSYNETIDSYSSPSLGALSLPGSLLCGTYFLFGPLAGALVNRFDYRAVAMVGAVTASLCCLFSALFMDNLLWFTVIFGLIGGIGCGLIYLPAITVVGHWFEHRRAFVVGVALCGSGLGAGVLAMVVRPLSHSFAPRGVLILTAGLFCQTLVGIALFRPLYVHELIKIAKVQRKRHNDWLLKLVEKRKTDRRKHESDHKTLIQRGSIMARIIEEKSRQRTTSTGSLDGMVITRENELVALPSSEAYMVVMAAAEAYTNQQERQTANDFQGGCTSEEGAVSKTNISTAATSCERYLAPVTYKNLQTLEEGVPLPSGSDRYRKMANAYEQPCVAVLPPPVQFSRTAIRRIACAILRKLQVCNYEPYDSYSGLSTLRNRYSSPGGSHNESWAASDTGGTPGNFFEEKMGRRNPSIGREGRSSVAVGEDVCSTVAFWLVAGIHNLLFRCWNLEMQFTSMLSTYLHLHFNHDLFQLKRSYELQCSKLPSPLRGDSQRSSFQLASMMSLDSRTEEIITRELKGIPLDEQTRIAILAAVRAELSRPKYRIDLFYCAGRKPYSADNSRKSSSIGYKCMVDSQRSGWRADVGGSQSEVTSRKYAMLSNGGFSSPVKDSPSIAHSKLAFTPSREPALNTVHLAVPNQGSTRISSWLETVEEYASVTGDVTSYLRDMLDTRLLTSCTFIWLLLACSLNMFILLVPFHYLPLLLELGGLRCQKDRLWCPKGLPYRDHQNPDDWLSFVLEWGADSSAFANTGTTFLMIGVASVVGRMLAALYIEKRVNTRCKQCAPLNDPMVLNSVSLLLCGSSLACLPFSIHGVHDISPTSYQRNSSIATAVTSQTWPVEHRLFLFYSAATVFGFSLSITLSLRSVILVELFGIRRLTNAFGYLLIVQGLSLIAGPPLFGWFLDASCHGYLESSSRQLTLDQESLVTATCTCRLIIVFYISGALFVSTGLLFIPLRWLSRHDLICCCSAQSRGSCIRNRPNSREGARPFEGIDDAYSLGSVGSVRVAPYDPQETQTTQLMPDAVDVVQPLATTLSNQAI
ncbi:unnamed protein product [Calicophoron daubneyi]|uniref:Monocarboxylate transporter n=1 Tax=Calicophoron daubneyi TaxID=300641 RepID=A0AAV2TWU2_CALDB